MNKKLNNVTSRTIEFGIDYITHSSGTFKVIERIDNNNYKIPRYRIKFNTTGKEYIVTSTAIAIGEIRDPYFPKIFGIGYCGMANTTYDGKHNTKEYIIWHMMLSRCYNPVCKEYPYYGALGIYVCDRWLCFEYFLEDLPKIPGYNLWKNSKDGITYQLDKDSKQIGEKCKVYSLETCAFVSQHVNKMIKSISNSDKYSSKNIGVSKVKNSNNSYESYIEYKSKRIHLGAYDNEIAASAVRDAMAVRLYGRDCILNNAGNMSYDEIKSHCTSRSDKTEYFTKIMCDGTKPLKVMCNLINKK